MDESWSNPNGVPISAFLFGGRRYGVFPLVTEAWNWDHGVFLGSLVAAGIYLYLSLSLCLLSNTIYKEHILSLLGIRNIPYNSNFIPTSYKSICISIHFLYCSPIDHISAEGQRRVVRESFAMIPYCAYNMNEYFNKWQGLRQILGYNIPKIFHVNCFRKDEQTGQYLWPGYGENSRILKWIVNRLDGSAHDGPSTVVKTPIGYVPSPQSLDLKSLDISPANVEKVLAFNRDEWKREIQEIKQFYGQFGEGLPEFLKKEVQALENALS